MQLTIDHLAVDRGARRILQDLSFTVQSGEALVLRGPNGAGKTTLIRALAGLIPPADGRILFSGGNPDLDLPAQAHYVGHLNAVKSGLTVGENLRFWAAYLAPERSAGGTVKAIDEAMDAFALTPLAAVPAGYLSAGQKRRACLARLRVAPRPVWLLDEPTVSLDTSSVALLARQIETHTANGGLVLAATHIPLGLAGERVLDLGVRREHAG